MTATENEWYKGKIYSVEVENFVTYDYVMYYPGHYLNVILGPNGTGKSSLVAAIVLGMGGQPKTLARSQNIEDYVKNGKDQAKLEILIYKDSKEDKIKFKRIFNIDGQNKYFVDNIECSLKKYIERVAEFNIQINNLCQFLPQDRVQDFAKMNPQELLTNTQSSVCSPECVQMLEQLKELRAEQKGSTNTLSTQINTLHEHEGRLPGLKEQVADINRRSDLAREFDICSKKKAWMEFEELFIKYKEMENDLKKANENVNRAQNELTTITGQSSESLRSKNEYETRIKNQNETTVAMSNKFNKLEEKTFQLEDSIVKAEGDLTFAKNNHKENAREMEEALVLQRVFMEDLKAAASKAGNEKDKKARHEEILKERTIFSDEIRSLSEKNRKILRCIDEEIKPNLNSLNNKIEQMENTNNIKLELLRTKYDQIYQGILWLRGNQRKFRGKVYEPMILEVLLQLLVKLLKIIDLIDDFYLNVRSGYAKYFENTISTRDLLAFSCENVDDVQLLFKHLRVEQKLEVHIIYVKATQSLEFESPPIMELDEFGFQYFLLELIDGPIPIINYLCRIYKIHTVPVGTDRTLKVADNVPPKHSLFFTPNHRFFVVISEYSRERLSECQEIVSHNLLSINIDYGLLEKMKLQRDTMIRSSDKYRNEQGSIENQIKVAEDKINDLDSRKSQIESLYINVTSCKQKLQLQISKIENLKLNAVDLSKETENFNSKIQSILRSLIEIHQQKLETVGKHSTAQIALICQRKKFQIFLRTFAEVENRLLDAEAKLKNAKSYLQNISKVLEEAKTKCKKQQELACKLTDNKKPSDARNFPYKKQFDKLPDTLENLIDHMNEIQGQLECVRNYSPEVIIEYETILRDIDHLKKIIEKSHETQSNLSDRMDSIHKLWYEEILNVVNGINRNFSNFMMSMGFAGEVELTRANERDYEKYGIAIRVKFRNDEQLQSLDRFVQSGGERAVAIAAYTLSLQHMSHVPFRCVDEINQGMDPTNERLIFNMLVKEISQPGKAQFFFVTPKLLLNLNYNKYMTVSIVFNGKHVSDPHVFQNIDSQGL